jgi:hypothetical protein
MTRNRNEVTQMKTLEQFHDGFLNGLLIQNTTVYVFISTDKSKKFVLEGGDVLSLKADGFRQGNIIYDVLVRDGDEVTLEDIQNFYEFKDEANALKKLEDVRRKTVVVLEINPSYGASCLILAGSVDLITYQEWSERRSIVE